MARPKGAEGEETKMKRAIRKAMVHYLHSNKDTLIKRLVLETGGIRYLMDQVLGKPVETMNVGGDPENPIRMIDVKVIGHIEALPEAQIYDMSVMEVKEVSSMPKESKIS